MLVVVVGAPAALGQIGNTTADTSFWVMTDTKYKKLDTMTPAVNIYDPDSDFLVTYHENVAGSTPIDLIGGSTPKGRLGWTLWCGSGPASFPVAEGTSKVGKNGTAYFAARAMAQYNCEAIWATFNRKGGYVIPAGTSVRTRLNASKIEDGGCVPDGNTLCLQDGRFRVTTTWDDGSARGKGHVIPSGNDAGLFYFFNADNTEALVKVLDGCSFNSHFWVFAGAATSVEYTLTVVDTQTSETKQYSNALGSAAPPILDTNAFATCP
jgi:hypothetical protein